jgi:hypothetical protein
MRKENSKQKENKGGKSRFQVGAGATCVLASPPPTPPYLAEQVRELPRRAPPSLYPSPITADFQRQRRIFVMAS